MTAFKPMLAETLKSLDQVRYPVACTPKLDGVRCVIHPKLGPVSRKLKPIPNDHVRSLLATLPPYLDGELMIPGAQNFGEVSSAIMRKDGEPNFEYWMFDCFRWPTVRYDQRVDQMIELCLGVPGWAKLLPPRVIAYPEDLIDYEQRLLARGYEGVMLRDPSGPYKFGRSTLKQGWLLKLKRFADAEAEVVGVEEMQHNQNEQENDNLGYAKRSSRKAGQVAAGVLGALICRRPDGLEFRIGSGFTAEQRAQLWASRDALTGRLVTYRYQPVGAKDAPRFPTYQGLRHGDDL